MMIDVGATTRQLERGLRAFGEAIAHADRGRVRTVAKMDKYQAERHILDIAQKAEAIAGSHITGMTFQHADLRKLAEAIRVKLAEPVT